MNYECKRKFLDKFAQLMPELAKFEPRRKQLALMGKSAEFKKELKAKFINEFLSCFDFIKHGCPDGYSVFSNNMIRKSSKETFAIDDQFYGCYNGVNYRITEITNAMIRGKKRTYSGPWRGVILNIDFNKPTKTKILLTPKGECGAMTIPPTMELV